MSGESTESAVHIWTNANIITMDPLSPRARAVAFCGGKILAVAVGVDDQESLVSAFPGGQLLDLRGQTVVPGFVESHTHLVGEAQNFGWTDVNARKCPTYADVLATIKQAADTIRSSTPADQLLESSTIPWVKCVGYDDTLIAESKGLQRIDLDGVAPDLPVWVWHPSLHRSYVNSVALRLAAVTPDTLNPPGGMIGKDDSGQLSGQLDEMPAFNLVYSKIKQECEERQNDNLWATAKNYAAKGVTTAYDLWVGPVLFQRYVSAFKKHCDQDGKRFPIRVGLYAPAHWDPPVLPDSPFLSWIGRKFILDGSIQCYTACCHQAYYDRPEAPHDELKPNFFTTETARLRQLDLHKRGIQMAAHCNGDKAIDYFLDNIEEAQRLFPRNDHRHRIEHSQTASLSQLERMAQLGVSPSFFVAHVYFWGDRHASRFLGPDRASHISPLNSASKLNIRFSLHNDSPVTPVDPLHSIWVAVSRTTRSGLVLGEDERVSVEQALKAFTLDAAFLGFEDQLKGSVSVGKFADFAVLSADPFAVAVDDIPSIRVLATVCHGELVFGSTSF